MSSFISIFKTLFRVGIGFVCLIIVAEIFLQCFPVKTGFKRPIEIAAGHPPHWQPNQSFTYSSGWRMDNPREGSINNKGYPAPHDFIDGEKAIIVIGDSFVENQMNDWDESFMGRLHSDDLPVYSFGLSGATIADYIGLAKHTSKTYKPQHIIIMLTDGDITSAASPYQAGHYFIEDKTLKQSAYSQKNAKTRNFFKQSALIRYAALNLQLQRKIAPSTNLSPQNPTSHSPLESRYQFFIDEICDINHQNNFRTTLILNLKDLKAQNLKQKSQKCPTIQSINTLEIKDNLKTNKNYTRLDYAPYDLHWNATMHGHVYEALKEKLPF